MRKRKRELNNVNVVAINPGYDEPKVDRVHYAKAVPMWKMYSCTLPGSPLIFNVLDSTMVIPISYGVNRICYREPNGDDKAIIKKAEQGLAGVIKPGELEKYRVMTWYMEKPDVLSAAGVTSEQFAKLKDLSDIRPALDAWKKFQIDTIMDGCKKDPLIPDLILPLFVNIPKGKQHWNSHCLILTGTKTGKSEIASNVGVDIHPADFSTAGMLGSHMNSKDIPGELSGPGVTFIDEIIGKRGTNQVDTEVNANDLLPYFEQGEVTRGKLGNVHCSGTKTIIMAGNTNDDAFGGCDRAIDKLAGDVDAERYGSRFALPIFRPPGAMMEVEIVNPFTPEVKRDRIEVFKHANYHIAKIVNTVVDVYSSIWMEKDRRFMDEIRDLAPLMGRDRMVQFFRGYGKAQMDQRLHYWALRAAIELGIPILMCIEKDSDIKKYMLNEKVKKWFIDTTNEYWERIKLAVLESAYWQMDVRMLEAFIMSEDGRTNEVIAELDQVTSMMVSRWISQVKKVFVVPGVSSSEARSKAQKILDRLKNVQKMKILGENQES